MRRRRLLATLPFVTGLSGCGGLAFDADEATPTPTTTGTARPTSESEPPDDARSQFVSVKNTRSSDVYLTLVVEGESTFVESLELFPGEEVRFPVVVGADGEREVVLETTDGERATYQWQPAAALDGLATYLTTGGVEFWRHVRCLSGCAVDEGGESADLPLIGDGSGRWYAPASVVVRNPAGGSKSVDLGVSLRGESLLAKRYRLLGESQLSVPISYRTGEYTVEVTVDGRTLTNQWPVPDVPQRHVTLGEGVEFGCGPADTTLALSNRDSEPHTLVVEIRRDDQAVFERRVRLDAKTERRLTSVARSGPYEVVVERDPEESDSSRTTATWWSCPPRGPATIVVNAAGGVSLQQGGPRPG